MPKGYHECPSTHNSPELEPSLEYLQPSIILLNVLLAKVGVDVDYEPCERFFHSSPASPLPVALTMLLVDTVRCQHAIALPDEEIVCELTRCKFSSKHPAKCPQCTQTCWQYIRNSTSHKSMIGAPRAKALEECHGIDKKEEE
ncbi:hypothetical protein EW146_g1358 [Bondarzewia mesenterica]|uniref:Uncharacterized protein n=1 Tax=Bondarzewia mesenterica TaxID=1095465 RepID=A0A4S4M6F5_9AGAM|nr:hypothetical protein EW146_g1358 [Bondarzewia mesenterica]